MDAGYPEDSRNAVGQHLLARTLSCLFAADNSRRPWQLLLRDTADTTSERFTLGWVTAAAGTAPAR